ncbi:gliding motility-associated C-terminal domain-containing protein [Flavobacterium phycosphaerae]|uniref:gliding motility-associated C-terminal domain-containing protein n=1 Tax=Flavobacterium phycosphaerae TaxID=2697515 RepID=UPI00138A549F|nr:gliding motility-associated C-terminal domain-containing protein [Flavobacterium phycosphaerae]
MRITTLVKKYCFNAILLLFFFGISSTVSAQCPTIANANQSFCDTQSPIVGSLVATDTGGGIRWYTTSTGGTPLSNSFALNDGVYYADDIAGDCPTRPSVTVTIYSKPTAVLGSIQFCQASTVADLAPYVIGNQIKWYATSTGGSVLASSTPLVSGATYFASQTNPDTGCETSRKGFSVTITIVPTPTGDSTPTFCSASNPLVADLDANGTNLLWYLTSTSGIELDSFTPLVDGQTYYAESNVGNCPSPTRLAVTVTIEVPNNAGSSGQFAICEDIVPSTAPFDLFDFLGDSPDTVGTWTGPLATSNGYQGTVDVSTMTPSGSPYVFTYSVSTSAACSVAQETVTITIIQSPVASVSFNPPVICANTNSDLLFTGTPNATVTYNINGGGNQTIVLNGSGNATLSGTYAVDTTVNLVSVKTATLPGCVKAVGQIVTLTVIDPTASASFSQPVICANTNADLTFTGTPNATVTYTINGGANQTIVLDATGNATLSGTYTVDTTVTLVSVTTAGLPTCTKLLGQTLTLTVIDPIASASFSPLVICANTNADLIFTGTPNATVTYTIDGGASQTIVLDAAGTATLSGTYAVNTTVTLVSVTTAGVPSCAKLLGQTITLTVIDPTATASFSLPVICANTNSDLVFTGTPNATVTYTINGGGNQTIVLDAAGTAALPGTYTADTTITLVSVTTAGAPSCTKLLGQTVTLTVIDPTASASFSLPVICANTNSDLVFTGTPNATVTYTINGGGNQTIVLDATGTATLSGTYTVNTTVILVSVTTAGVPSCTKVLGQTVTLTVIDPTATASFSPLVICANTNSILTFTGTPNATVTYTINGGGNQTIVLDASGTATLPGSYTINTTVTLVSVTTAGVPSCTKLLGQTVILTVIDPTASASFSLPVICANTNSDLVFTGTPNATVTYTINGGGNQTIVLDAAGTATLPGTYAVNTIVTLVSVTTAGAPSCTKVLGQTVALTVIDPTATASFSQPVICANTNSDLVFTGTPNATVTYTINGGANQTIVLDATGNATLSGTYTVDTTVTLVSVTTSGVPSCTKLLGQIVTLTVIDPTASVSFDSPTICANTNADLTFTGTPNATVTYTVNGGGNQTVVLNGAGTATFPGTYAINTTITLVSVTTAGLPSCTKLLTETVTLTVIDPTASASFSQPVICANTSTDLVFTGTPNATVTYTINGGGNQTIVLDAAGAATLSGTYTADTTITLVNVTTAGVPSCTKVLGQTVTLTVINPTATASFSQPVICANTSSDLTFTGTPNATVTYTINGGGNQTIVLDATGNATLPGTYTANTTVTLVSITTSGVPSCTKLLGQIITLTVIDPTASVSLSSSVICANTNATATFTGTPNATVTYTINGGGNQTIVLDAAGNATLVGTFTVDTTITLVSVTTSGLPSCTKLLGQTVTLTVNPQPNAGVSPGPISVCKSDTSFDLVTLLGATAQTNGVWSPALASGTSLFDPAVDLSNTYTYTVTGIAPCTTDSESIQITVNPVPDAGDDRVLPLCSNQNPVDLFVSLNGTPQTGGVWRDPSNTVISNILNPATAANGNYTYTVAGIPPCADDIATITVTITPGPEAGVSGPFPICANSVPYDLFTQLGVNAQPGGVWTNPSNVVVTGVFDPAVDPAGDYTYTLTGINPCDNDVAVITVAITPVPDAGIGSSKTLCTNGVPVDLFTLLGGTPQTGGVWTDSSNAVVSNMFDPTTGLSGDYTYTVVGGQGCTPASAIVSIIVLQAPNAGGGGPTSVCIDSTGLDLINFLDGTQGAGTFSDDDSTGALSGTIFNPSLMLPGVYHFTYTVTGGPVPCTTDTAVVTVTVVPLPNAGTAIAGTQICSALGTLDLMTLLQNADAAGLWYDMNDNEITNPIDVSTLTAGTYSFYYMVSNDCGSSDPTVVTFDVLETPNAGADGGPTSVCIDSAGIDLINLLDGTQGVGTFADDDATGALTGTIFNPSAVTAGVYHFTYTVSGGAPSCIADTAVVTVTVVPLPNAGTFVAGSPVCNAVDTIDLNTLLQNADSTGLWYDMSDNPITNPVDVSTFAAGTYSYYYMVSNDCGSSDPTIVSFEILANPTIDNTNILIPQVCIANDVTVNLSGMVDGTYTLNYDLTGSNVAANQTVTVTVTSGTASFIIPTATVPATGSTTITFTNIQNTTTTCQSALTNVSATILINPVAQLDDTNISVATVCIGSDATVTITNAINLPDGNYQFDYTIPTGNPTTGNSGIVTFAGGNGSFTIPGAVFATANNYSITINTITAASGCSNASEDAATSFNVVNLNNAGTFVTPISSVCSSVGVIDLNTLLTGQDLGGTWTDSTNTVVTSPINIVTFATGTYSYTYTANNGGCAADTEVVQFNVLASPKLTTLNLTAASICIGANGIVNFNGMTDGVYTLNYDLTGVNPLAGQVTTVTISGGTGSFVIPSAALPNSGLTVITFTNITDTTTTCFSLINVPVNLLVKPLADLDATNLTIPSVCFGSPVVVNIANATGLPDAVYQFNYAIQGPSPSTGTTANVTVIGGVGTFSFPASMFPLTGNYSMTVIGIISLTGCTNPAETALATFAVNAIPDPTGALITAQDTCLASDSAATISGATNLPDGNYTILYDLSGANSATAVSTTVAFVNGTATVIIPGASLTADGATTITVTSITYATTGCSGPLTAPVAANFAVATLAPPTLLPDGFIFCDDDNPKVLNLTANIVPILGQTVIWYDAPTGGTAYDENDLLVDGTTYYAAAVAASGCESGTRLPVQVDLSGCPDIKIPDGFSPNDDGINDTFEINNLAQLYPKFTLEIYNRYGNKVYQGDINTPNWNGTTTEKGLNLGDNLLPTGVYFFIINFNDGARKPYQDRVYLSR